MHSHDHGVAVPGATNLTLSIPNAQLGDAGDHVGDHQHEPSQLIVHKGDGKIEEERTYRDDPYPPAG